MSLVLAIFSLSMDVIHASPQDLLCDNPCPVVADAVLTEPLLDAARIRLAARQAVVATQDSKVRREALRARPRLRRTFELGQWVAYRRTQKLEKRHCSEAV